MRQPPPSASAPSAANDNDPAKYFASSASAPHSPDAPWANDHKHSIPPPRPQSAAPPSSSAPKSPRTSSRHRSPSPSPRASQHAHPDPSEPLSARISTLLAIQQKAQGRQRSDLQKLSIALVLDQADQVAEILNQNQELVAEYSPSKLLQLSLPHQPQIMSLALSRGADPNTVGKDNVPGIFAAIRVPDAWKVLVQYGADLKVEYGNLNVLQSAILREDKELISALYDAGIDFDKEGVDGKPPALFFAISVNAFNSVVYLLDAGADPRATYRGQSILHAIIANRSLSRGTELAEAVLSKSGPELFEQLENKGMTPFLYAVHMGRIQFVNLLMNLGANIHAVDSQGSNALWVMLLSPFSLSNPELVPLLLNAGVVVDQAADNVVSRLNMYISRLRSSGVDSKLLHLYLSVSKEFEKMGYVTTVEAAPLENSAPGHAAHFHEPLSAEIPLETSEAHHHDDSHSHHSHHSLHGHQSFEAHGQENHVPHEQVYEEQYPAHEPYPTQEYPSQESYPSQEAPLDFGNYQETGFDGYEAQGDDGQGQQDPNNYFAQMDGQSDPFAGESKAPFI
jgi:ankyrin repeat protein